MGVGNELKGDDAAGVIAARLLREGLEKSVDLTGRIVDATHSYYRAGRLLVIDAGAAPENFTGVLRSYTPAHVVIVDAAWLDSKPGAIQVVDPEQVNGFGASTHLQPLSILAQYLRNELACEVSILGIQAQSSSLGAGLSPDVLSSCHELATFVCQWVIESEK